MVKFVPVFSLTAMHADAGCNNPKYVNALVDHPHQSDGHSTIYILIHPRVEFPPFGHKEAHKALYCGVLIIPNKDVN